MNYLHLAQETLETLRNRAASVGTTVAPVKPPPGPEETAAMTLEEFSRAGLVVQVNSQVLGCRVLFVSDDVPESSLTGTEFPIYRAAELRRLAVLRPAPHNLRSLHEAKTIFEGVIADVTPNDQV